MAVPVSSACRRGRAARSSRSRRLVPLARLVGALVGVVVLAAGCGTAAASDGAAAARASASPSGATRVAPVCTCGGTQAAAALGSAHVGDLDVNAGYAVTSVLSLDGTTTTAYMSIANAGLQPAGLVGASSTKATSVQLDNAPASGSNAETITAVDSIPIAAGGIVALAPGGYHLMVMGLSAPLRIGDTLPLTLHFSGGRTAHLTLPVEAR
jgi:periplasmic copper chaperone A